MITNQLALIRREIWEHRSIYITPVAIATIVILGTIYALVFVSGFATELNAVLFGATNVAEAGGRKLFMAGVLVVTSWPFLFALVVLMIFYSLDSLYGERKDKSILFWRSLPVTDAETVLSKLTTAIVVIPSVSLIVIIATHIVNMILISIWVSAKGGDPGLLIWEALPLLNNWVAAIVIVFIIAVWMSPFIGWFLFVSAFSKRMPFLMAFMPLALIPLLEAIFLHSKMFASAVFIRGIDPTAFFDGGVLRNANEAAGLLDILDVTQFMNSPAVWAGIVVCGLLSTAAIYVRRYRGEG